MQRWRINFILASLLFSGVVIIGRLFYVQIIQGDFNKALARGQYSSEKETIGERGEIFFKKGEPLAVNMDWFLVFVSPAEIEEKEKTAEKLADALLLNKDSILEKIKKNTLYEVIKKKITDEEIGKLKDLNLAGVYLKKETGRYYPQETLASQVIGFLDADKTGQYGLENYYEEILRGGKKNERGSDLFLTIDYSVQFKAEKLLESAKENLDIEGGEIIVVEPDSGEILALAVFPNFNPNQYSKIANFDVFQNSATQKFFEPGSVFKPLTMAAALEEQKITPQTAYLDKGVVEIGGWLVKNYDNRVWGERTMTEVLEKSINTGAVFAEQQLGHNLFLKYVEKFGIFSPSGIDLQEVYSENKEFKKGYEINFTTASFGQGIEMTPIQLIRAYSAIANRGKLATPYIVKKVASGVQVLENAPEATKENLVVSPKTASQLTAMLISVVENGFAKSAKIPGYYVAGKTGTAQVAWSALAMDKKGYSAKTWQSFIGFAPAFNPQFLILVKLNNPKSKTAEYSAAPIFRELAKYIIDYYQIPPDYYNE